RKDRLEKLLFQQCGPIRYLGEDDADPHLRKRLHIMPTDFGLSPEDESYRPLHEIWEKLVEDDSRNDLIVSCLATQLENGRRCVVLSDRLAHLDTLRKRLERRPIATRVLC